MNSACPLFLGLDAGVVEPEASHKRIYDDHYGKYVATSPALRALMHRQNSET